jgi:hypothetical protein
VQEQQGIPLWFERQARIIAPLLDCGFHIIYNETYLSSAAAPFFDARCYIAAGSDLF